MIVYHKNDIDSHRGKQVRILYEPVAVKHIYFISLIGATTKKKPLVMPRRLADKVHSRNIRMANPLKIPRVPV